MAKIKNSYLVLILTIAYCLLPIFFYAQTKSTLTKTINGKKFYIHKVEKGQSLYAISKVYSIDVNSILAENDEAIDGLKPGQELKIPFESLLSKTTLAIDTNKYVYHKILKGETVYAITKKYNIQEEKLASYNPSINSGLKEGVYIIIGEKKKISKPATIYLASESYTVLQGETIYGISKKINTTQDELLKLNPEIKDGIKQGQLLKIPSSKKIALTNTVTTTYANVNPAIIANDTIISKPKKENYNIGLFLPFKFIESEGINIDELARGKAIFPPTQSLAIDFYVGFKKAVDSLTSKDFDINILLFDTDDRDSSKIGAICKTSEFKNLDVIFGPFFLSVFKIVAKAAKENNTPIISPVIQQNKILFDNALASKVTPSVFTLIENLADYTLDSLSSANVIIVNATAKDQQYIKAFKNKFNEGLDEHKKSLKDSVIEVKGIAGVKAAFVAGKKNVIVLLTNNQVYLQDFITQLHGFSDKKDIMLMGFSSVANIDNLDQDYLNGLNYHFAATDHINLKDSTTRQLAKYYQEFYIADPSESYFQGFDIATYYLSHLKNQGPSFFLNLDKYNWNGITTDFKFFRPDNETGFENRSTIIYKYSNYQLQKIGWK